MIYTNFSLKITWAQFYPIKCCFFGTYTQSQSWLPYCNERFHLLDLGTAENSPSEERDDFYLAAKKAFPSINPATTASEAFGAQVSVGRNEITVGTSAYLKSDCLNHNNTVFSQDSSASSMVSLQHNSPVSNSNNIRRPSQATRLYCGSWRDLWARHSQKVSFTSSNRIR